MKFRTLGVVAGLCAVFLGGCAAEEAADQGKEIVEPDLGVGKADVADRVAIKGRLVFGEEGAIAASFTKDFEFHGYTLEVFESSTLTLEVTQKGSSRGLDTTMFVYGPEKAGSFGEAFAHKDDDEGFGALSRLKGLKLDAGSYLVIIGTATATGRGNYRLMASCLDGACEAPAEDVDLDSCPGEIEELLRECIRELSEDLGLLPEGAWGVCLDDLDVLDTFEGLCFEDALNKAPAWCAAGEEAFSEALLPNCVDLIGEDFNVSSEVTLTRKTISDELDEEVLAGMEVCEDFCEMEVSAFTFETPSGGEMSATQAATAAIAKVLSREVFYSVGSEVDVSEFEGDLQFRGMENFLALCRDFAGDEGLIIGQATATSTPAASVDAFHTGYVLVFNKTKTMIVLEVVDFTE